MNTETGQDNIVPETTGARLRRARQALGLTEQTVAERLCLRVSTVREIEEDKMQANLASTFQRGYIRSYAKLVHIPEDELLPLPTKDVAGGITKSSLMGGVSLGKKRKKRDTWLMGLTWLIVLIVLGLTCAWWWQNHQIRQVEITTMANQSSSSVPLPSAQSSVIQSPTTQRSHGDGSVALSLPDDRDVVSGKRNEVPLASSGNLAGVTPVAAKQNLLPFNGSPTGASGNGSIAMVSDTVMAEPSTEAVAVDRTTSVDSAMPLSISTNDATFESKSDLLMNFSADCWIQVIDISGKTLFRGIQKKGATLNLSGKAPYKLTVGVPSAVSIQYQGERVNLAKFIKAGSIARLTVGVE